MKATAKTAAVEAAAAKTAAVEASNAKTSSAVVELTGKLSPKGKGKMGVLTKFYITWDLTFAQERVLLERIVLIRAQDLARRANHKPGVDYYMTASNLFGQRRKTTETAQQATQRIINKAHTLSPSERIALKARIAELLTKLDALDA